MALEIASDAKIQYPSACNAMETLLVHKDVAAAFFPKYAGTTLCLCMYMCVCARMSQRGKTETEYKIKINKKGNVAQQ